MGSNLNRKLAAALGCRVYLLQPFRTGIAGFVSQVNDGLMFENSSNPNIRWYSNQYSGKVDRSQRQRSSGREEAIGGGLLYHIVVEGDNRDVHISKERMTVLKVRMDCGWLVPMSYECLFATAC